jgi:hypothetical protein
MTDAADRLLPHPDDAWYDRTIGTTGLESPSRATPEQRRSYVRFILAGHGGVRSQRLDAIADHDPAAIAAWADRVADFDDELLDRLGYTEPVGFRRACAGASDAAVDRLAERIAAAPPGEPGSNLVGYPDSPAHARVELLLGVDTDHALLRAAELGRAHEHVRDLAEWNGVDVPATGPGIRRYVPRPVHIMYTEGEPDPRLLSFPPVDEVLTDPRGHYCPVPLVVPLDIDLSVLPGDPLAAAPPRRFRFLAGICDECSEGWWEQYDWQPAGDGRLTLVDIERQPRCDGSDAEPPEPATTLAVDPFGPLHPGHDHRRHRARLGGRPSWRQTWRAWPPCCGRPMFYVGQLDLADYGGSGIHLYGFQCECGTGVQIPQVLL